MLKRILYTLLSVLLLSLPWLGGSALTLFVAFVPLLWVEHSLAGQTVASHHSTKAETT